MGIEYSIIHAICRVRDEILGVFWLKVLSLQLLEHFVQFVISGSFVLIIDRQTTELLQDTIH